MPRHRHIFLTHVSGPHMRPKGQFTVAFDDVTSRTPPIVQLVRRAENHCKPSQWPLLLKLGICDFLDQILLVERV